MYINEIRSNIRRTTLIRETSVICPLSVLLFKSNDLSIKEVDDGNYLDEISSKDQVVLEMSGTQLKFLCNQRFVTASYNRLVLIW